MSYEFARYVLWVLPTIVLVALLVRRGAQMIREFPFFFCYILCVTAQGATGLALHLFWHPLYVRSYWPSQALLIALAFAALYEVFAAVLTKHQTLAPIAHRMILLAALAFAAVAVTWLGGLGQSTLVQTILALQQALRLVQVGALMIAFIFASFFHLRWSDDAFGIALGFGLYGTLDLLILALTRTGILSAPAFVLMDPLAYNFAVLIWVSYLFRTEPRPVAQALPHHDMQHWNAALRELLQR